MTVIDYLWAAASVILGAMIIAGVLLFVMLALYMSDKEKMEAQHAEG